MVLAMMANGGITNLMEKVFFIRADGARYDGERKYGKKHGKGIATYIDGSSYDGEWKDGQRHGIGIAINADGSSYNGKWENGEVYKSEGL